MTKSRLEAFSDGVLAIIITIMVLELKAPQRPDWESLGPLIPGFLSYVLSFLYVGLYWNNHHHLFQAVGRINGGVLWANLHLLFWLSLVPFVTHWMGNTNFAQLPVAAYGVVLLAAAFSYWLLVHVLVRHQGPDSPLAKAIGRDRKGKISIAIYVAAILISYFSPMTAGLGYAFVAILWLIPDRRIEKVLPRDNRTEHA